MAAKHVRGRYPSGYDLDPAFQSPAIDASAVVGGAGIAAFAAQRSFIPNLGMVDDTQNGITLSDGGMITSDGRESPRHADRRMSVT